MLYVSLVAILCILTAGVCDVLATFDDGDIIPAVGKVAGSTSGKMNGVASPTTKRVGADFDAVYHEVVSRQIEYIFSFNYTETMNKVSIMMPACFTYLCNNS